ncbi:MAG: hypothetical protein JKY57_03560 [Kordiimonadaceae bacterium]|nr:hypothetical protein [Kordiimonadaceae bacterium]
MQQSVIIKSQFNGPPKSANGGYAAGILAAQFDGGVEISLHVPPPLDTKMMLTRVGDAAKLVHGDTVVATATVAVCDFAVPVLPNPLVLGSSPLETGGEFAPFVTCFVCGNDRSHGDGLCLYCKLVEGHPGLVAAPWSLHDAFTRGDGTIDPLYIWSALDCPGYFACAPGEAAVLGRFTGQILAPLEALADATVLGWSLDDGAPKGRKRRCGTAVYAADGTLVAKAEGIWILIDPSKMPS